jgi:hypothetical protein
MHHSPSQLPRPKIRIRGYPMKLFAELKRRNVFRVASFYLASAWLKFPAQTAEAKR